MSQTGCLVYVSAITRTAEPYCRPIAGKRFGTKRFASTVSYWLVRRQRTLLHSGSGEFRHFFCPQPLVFNTLFVAPLIDTYLQVVHDRAEPLEREGHRDRLGLPEAVFAV